MPHVRLPLPAVAIVCGAALLGWSLGGVASVDRDLAVAASSQPPTRHDHLVLDRGAGCHEHRERQEL